MQEAAFPGSQGREKEVSGCIKQKMLESSQENQIKPLGGHLLKSSNWGVLWGEGHVDGGGWESGIMGTPENGDSPGDSKTQVLPELQQEKSTHVLQISNLVGIYPLTSAENLFKAHGKISCAGGL